MKGRRDADTRSRALSDKARNPSTAVTHGKARQTVVGVSAIPKTAFRLALASGNPSALPLRVSVLNARKGSVQIEMYDVGGARVYQQDYYSNGNGSDSLDVSTLRGNRTLKPGLYFVQAIDASGAATASIKVVLLK